MYVSNEESVSYHDYILKYYPCQYVNLSSPLYLKPEGFDNCKLLLDSDTNVKMNPYRQAILYCCIIGAGLMAGVIFKRRSELNGYRYYLKLS